MLVSSPWHCKMCSRFASKRGGCPKAVLVSSGGAQNCASKLRVTILLRDPLTIPDINSAAITVCSSCIPHFVIPGMPVPGTIAVVSRCPLQQASIKLVKYQLLPPRTAHSCVNPSGCSTYCCTNFFNFLILPPTSQHCFNYLTL